MFCSDHFRIRPCYFKIGVMELKGEIRSRRYQSRQLGSGLTWGKQGIEVRGDGQDNVRKEERIKMKRSWKTCAMF